jgi:hypothetical protein
VLETLQRRAHNLPGLLAELRPKLEVRAAHLGSVCRLPDPPSARWQGVARAPLFAVGLSVILSTALSTEAQLAAAGGCLAAFCRAVSVQHHSMVEAP